MPATSDDGGFKAGDGKNGEKAARAILKVSSLLPPESLLRNTRHTRCLTTSTAT